LEESKDNINTAPSAALGSNLHLRHSQLNPLITLRKPSSSFQKPTNQASSTIKMVSIKSIAVSSSPASPLPLPPVVTGDTNVGIQQCKQDQIMACCDNQGGLASILIDQCTGNILGGSKFSILGGQLWVISGGPGSRNSN
jgi:hypothetical protein